MELILIRHLKTPGNEKRQYIGSTDEDLSEQEVLNFKKKCKQASYPQVQQVIVSPMKRCIQTAELIYPKNQITQEVLLKECDFGIFEGKTYEELKDRAEYQAWLDSGGTIAFPEGEEQKEFRSRCVRGMLCQVDRLCEENVESAAFVVHGGTIMACITGFLLDCMFGDPVWMYHPIRVIGNLISVLEKGLRKLLCSQIPASEQEKKNRREVLAGGILWILAVSLSFLVPAVLLFAARKIHPAVRFLLETFWCYQIFAARCLVGESKKVYQKLKEDDLPGARKAVSMIVGRDTENLTAEGVTKAAVETVAENTSDGVTAPLLFLLIGGAPLGFLYKAVNTMDSMLGYKNEKYLYFGRIPAKMDDVFNYIPARLTAWFMIVAAFLTGMDGKNAWKIYLRDKRKHASPNSAQSEAVCAGALDVQLAGDAVYFGKVYKKDYIGNAIRKIEPEDILRAGKLMYMTTILMMVVFGGLLLWIY